MSNNGHNGNRPYRPGEPILLTPDDAHSREAYIDFVCSIFHVKDHGYATVVHPADETWEFAAKAYPDRVEGPYATRGEAEKRADARVREVHNRIQKDVSERTRKLEKPVIKG